jgi:hypothetical protein
VAASIYPIPAVLGKRPVNSPGFRPAGQREFHIPCVQLATGCVKEELLRTTNNNK